jgi:hypothetical protein
MIKLLLAALIGVALASPARTDPTTEALFAEGIFSNMPAGQEITYNHARRGPASPGFTPVMDGRIVIATGQAADGTPGLFLTIETDGRQHQIADFPGNGGNPVLMIFLESAVNSMAAISGGSPYYIRNRIKDALREGGDVADGPQDFAGQAVATHEVMLHPFKTDPNRGRMGEFAELSLRFVVSDAVPGRFLLLSADTPDVADGYHETISLTGTEEGQ